MVLSFSIAGIPVRIHPLFFATALFLGAGSGESLVTLAVWMGVVLFSVLLHEMGHAFVGKLFGISPQIDLHAMGGTTSLPGSHQLGNGKRILISLAGPMSGIVLGTALLLARIHAPQPVLDEAIRRLIWVNLGWGIFNLVPMLPLDGGSVMASVLSSITGGRGLKPARIISIVVAFMLLIGSLAFRMTWIAFLAGLFIFQNVQGLRQDGVVQNDIPLADRLRRGVDALRRDDPELAIDELEPVARDARSPELRAESFRALAFAYASAQRWAQVLGLLEGEGSAHLRVGDLEEIEGRATALGLHEVARDLANARRRREAGTPISAEFRA
jgi:Zn-dependent protease